ncbi:MAG: GNAT family N-acetyltransferase [Deltaproteobacteria bacterium]
MAFSVRPARASDSYALRALMPRLAEFDIPPSRFSEHLWRGDEKLLIAYLAGDAPDSFCILAENDDLETLGLALVSMRPELLSGAPSAHLEAIAVSEEAEGQGVGAALLRACEDEAATRGAQSMTLHVFTRNERARAFYKKFGYDEELIRATKPLAR